jgi:hypothetical protein
MADAYRRMGEPVRKRLTEHEMELEPGQVSRWAIGITDAHSTLRAIKHR